MAARPNRAVLAGLALIAAAGPVSPAGRAQPGPPDPVPPPIPTGGQCAAHERVTTLGAWFNVNQTLTAAGPRRKVQAPDTGNAVALRLQLRVENPGDKTWRLVIRDPRQRALAVLAADDFTEDGALITRWTGILRWTQVYLDLEAASPAVKIVAEAALALPASSGDGDAVFSIPPGSPKWKALHGEQTATDFTNETIQRAGQSVGMMQTAVVVGGEKKTWCCSGVMVGSDLFLTNWHCGGTEGVTDAGYWKAACDNAIIDLGWDQGSTRRQLSCRGVVAMDKARDFALLRVRGALGEGAALRASPARVSLASPTADQPVFVVHHPQCEIKQVSESCRVVAPAYRAWTDPDGVGAKIDLTHTCATETGSSGGAVFDAEGRLIALHHAGFDTAAACARNDQVNKAVRIGEIRAALPDAIRPQLNVK